MTFTVPVDDLSPVEQLALADPDEQREALRRLSLEERHALLSWRGMRRAAQVPPVDEDWLVWFYRAGRGAGKTRSAAEEVIERVERISRAEYARWAVVTPTFGDFRDVAVEGESGLASVLLRRGIEHEWNRSNGELRSKRWTIQGYSSEKPDRLRGPQHHGAWLDEPGSYRWPKPLWDTLLPSLRLGRSPKILVTGTPKVTWLIRHLVSESKANPLRYRMSHSTTYRNAANLPAILVDELTRAYANTRLGRQELGGELLEEAEGALWTLADIDDWRAIDRAMRTDMTPTQLVDLPDVRDLRIAVGVDPAVTNTSDSDETGIVVAGAERGRWPHGFVLADLSGRYSMQTWGRRVIDACVTYGTNRVVAEVNQGGDLVESNINTARVEGDPIIHVEKIHAKKSKALRAGPVATLYEQHRVHHYGTFGELETQQVTWVPGEELPGQDSPDRVDALVYVLLDLMDVPVVGGALTQFTGSLRGR